MCYIDLHRPTHPIKNVWAINLICIHVRVYVYAYVRPGVNYDYNCNQLQSITLFTVIMIMLKNIIIV